jgi:hypothetical protein
MNRSPRNPSRRTVLGAAMAGAAAAALPGVSRAATRRSDVVGPYAASAVEALNTWQLTWAPQASADGLPAFENVEDDRANSHPAGDPHIFVENDNYRFNMHMVDRDVDTDRQRQEVDGMRVPAGGPYVQWLLGQTWRVTYSMYIPSELQATTTFTHIMQMKQPGNDTSPIVVQSLRRVSGAQTIELKLPIPNILVGRTSLDPLHDAWSTVDFQIKVGDGAAGWVRWILRDSAGNKLVDATKTGVDTFLADRVRPKWGIYRSLLDTSGSLEGCHLLITNLRGYQLVAAPPAVYQAEDATIFEGTVDTNHSGYTGSGFVNYANVVGSYVEWTVDTPVSASGTATFRYANGTTTNRPMDIAVNGTVVSSGHAFGGTGSWDTWVSTSVSVPLRPGTNTIRATATTSNGGPNVDKLTLS